jgi:hypothetical protein
MRCCAARRSFAFRFVRAIVHDRVHREATLGVQTSLIMGIRKRPSVAALFNKSRRASRFLLVA